MNILKRPYYFVSFLVYYFYLVLKSNFQIAADILTPGFRMDPGVVDIKLKLKSEQQILLLSNLISMTPGSLTLSYNANENSLKVHIMNNSSGDNFNKTADRMQDRIMKIIA